MSHTTHDQSAPWWKSAVIYQIYPRSFGDSSGDGVGDLAGITERLDHLTWLGVDVLWLSPFYRSPMHDFGYDVSDYCDVDPVFGTLADFDALLEAAHARGMRVLIDWVPAHTSIEHPWFVEARTSRTSSKRDWYVWRDAGPADELPNNWTSALTEGAPAWTLDEATGQLYLHSFLPEQPDLNWASREVQEAMQGVLRFWLDRGVDGFRGVGGDEDLEGRNVDRRIDIGPASSLSIRYGIRPGEKEGHPIRRLVDRWPVRRHVALGRFGVDVSHRPL